MDGRSFFAPRGRCCLCHAFLVSSLEAWGTRFDVLFRYHKSLFESTRKPSVYTTSMALLEATTAGGGARSYAMRCLRGVSGIFSFLSWWRCFCVLFICVTCNVCVRGRGACLRDDGFSFQGKVKPTADDFFCQGVRATGWTGLIVRCSAWTRKELLIVYPRGI